MGAKDIVKHAKALAEEYANKVTEKKNKDETEEEYVVPFSE